MILRDLSKGILWTENGFIFEPRANLTEAELNLLDYINDSTPDSINSDIHNLSVLKRYYETNDIRNVEKFIMNDLYGFTPYDDGMYAYIAGSTDKSPSVLYDMNKDILFIIHPNLSMKDKFVITPGNLIALLTIKKDLFKILQINKILGD
jgi:hypothetical protein